MPDRDFKKYEKYFFSSLKYSIIGVISPRTPLSGEYLRECSNRTNSNQCYWGSLKRGKLIYEKNPEFEHLLTQHI
jgi:hypothetical protein